MDFLDSKQELKRVLKVRDLVIFGMVFMAPVSAQILYGTLSQVSQGHAVLAYLIGLIAMIFTAYSYGKMAAVYPVAGSTYGYTSRAIHPYVGFLAGWGILLDYVLFPMLLYKVSALFAIELFPFIPFWLMLLLFVVPVTLFNYYGTKVTSRINLIMTFFMLLSIIIFVIFAIKALIGGTGVGSVFSLKGIYNAETFSWSALISGTSIAVLSYIGFDAVTTMAEDSTASGKMVGRAAMLACLFCTFFYIMQAYFATTVIPDFTSYTSADTAFFEISGAIGGATLATIVTLIISITGISTALVGQAAASRVLFAMGRDAVLPRCFSFLHSRHKTPVYSIFFMALLGYVGAILIELDTIYAIVVFGALIGFICVNLSVFFEYFIKRKQRTGKDMVKNAILPLLGLLVCSYILIGMDTIGQIVGGLWLVLGFLVLLSTTKGFKTSQHVKGKYF